MPPWVRLVLLLLLPLLTLAIYWDGQRYDADLLDFTAARKEQGLAALFPPRSGNFSRLEPVRHYGSENLYEYINGHAEYFRSAGFQQLAVGEYGPAGATQPMLVVDLFHMGEPLHAFGVLMDEAGEQAVPVAVGDSGFRVGGGLRFISGPLFVKMSTFSPQAEEQMLALAQAIHTLAGKRFGATAKAVFRFPELGRETGMRFIKESYRGMPFLNNCIEKSFVREGGEKSFPTFLAPGKPENHAALLGKLEAFLQGEGISFETVSTQGLSFTRVRDPYEGEWFYVPLKEGLFGVFQPFDEELGRAIALFASHDAKP
ncbi:MAG: hypothetical protein HQL56_10480 [Magnetococcales bacterium]|nr:hypothetical protein [Magnetococcales bacterium]